MALFCVAFRRDSVFLAQFPLLIHVQVFSCEISILCRLKCPYSCFSFPFCFLVIFVQLILVLSVLLLVAVINLPIHFLCCVRLFVSMHRCWLHCRWVFFLLLVLTHTVYQRHLCNLSPYIWSLVFFFFCPFTEVPPSFTSRMVTNILRGIQSRCLLLWWDFSI